MIRQNIQYIPPKQFSSSVNSGLLSIFNFISSSMKKIIFLTIVLCLTFSISRINAQNQWFSMPSFWEVGDPYNGFYAYNIESFDINKDGHLDLISGNWNDTYVFFGGHGILDTEKDLVYTGRMLAVCDYNGDGYKDMITMHYTSFDSVWGYSGDMLYYWGSGTTEMAIDTIPDYVTPLPTPYPTIEEFTTPYFTIGVHTGDFNNDGKTDLVFSSLVTVEPSEEFYNRGKIYISMGKSTPNDSADFVLIGDNHDANIGDFVQVGDMNGDGYDDLLYSSRLTTLPPGERFDSVNYLHIYYGSENFNPVQGNESELYSSLVNPRDSTAGWFIRYFSVDDINGDGIKDLVIGRTFYNYPHQTTIHYGSVNGVDTIPSFIFLQDTTTNLFFSAGGESQDVGDFNMDGYDDFIISPAGYQVFVLRLGGPHVSNGNMYGARGYLNGNDVCPQKSINIGDQTNDGVNDIAITSGGYILMLYGQTVHTNVKEKESDLIKGFNLEQNFPNPFNPTTTIRFDIPERTSVNLDVYNILGQKVKTLISNEIKNPGQYEVSFNKCSLASGVYIYRLVTKNYSQAKKMLLVK